MKLTRLPPCRRYMNLRNLKEGLIAYDEAELLHLMEQDDEETASVAIAAFDWAGLAQQPRPAPPPLTLVIDLTEDDEDLDTLAPDTRALPLEPGQRVCAYTTRLAATFATCQKPKCNKNANGNNKQIPMDINIERNSERNKPPRQPVLLLLLRPRGMK